MPEDQVLRRLPLVLAGEPPTTPPNRFQALRNTNLSQGQISRLFTPEFYVPDATTPGALTADDLIAHLGGIDAALRVIKIVTGSLDVTAASGDVNHNIVAASGIVRLRRAWFWISAKDADIGANTQNDITLSFFATDAFVHFINNANPNTGGRVAAFPEFQHVVQDVAIAISASDTVVNVDDGTLYSAESLIRLFKTSGPTEEFTRVKSRSADALTIFDTMQNAFALDDDVALVQELDGFDYEDADGTGEFHLKVSPDTGKDDFRLHWVIEYETA